MPVLTGKKEKRLMRDASYGVSWHFLSCESYLQNANIGGNDNASFMENVGTVFVLIF